MASPEKDTSDSENSELEGKGDDGEVKMVIEKDQDQDQDGDDKKATEDEDNEMIECRLSEDIYSVMFTAKIFGKAFIFALFVFCFQMGLIILILVDLIDRDSINPLKIPPGVTREVTAAQGMSVLLLLAVQEDIIEGLLMIHQGWQMIQDNGFQELKAKNQSATCSKWFLASILQLFAGCGLLVVIFILTMQSTDIIGMMLNFAALMFVSEIDNVAFSLAQRGFVSQAVRKEANAVSEFKLQRRSKGNSTRRMLFLLIFAGLISGYAILVHRQYSGKYLCQSIGVQFGDEYDSFLAPLSGVYDQGSRVNGRVAYYQRSTPSRAMFAYCEEDERWTFTWWAHESWKEVLKDMPNFSNVFIEKDPCTWHARSPPARQVFDITTTDHSRWEVVNNDVPAGTFYFEHFAIWCNDCEGIPDACGILNGKPLGKCDVDNKKGGSCVCEDGRYGLHCEFDEPCPFLAIDQRKEYSRVNRETWGLVKDPNTNKHVLSSERPVYKYDLNDGYVNAIVFRGRRWVVGTYETELFEALIQNAINRKDRGNMFQNNASIFYGLRHNQAYTSSFSSDEVDHSTSSYSYTPIGLNWYEVKQNTPWGYVNLEPDTNNPIDAPLLCAGCTDFMSNSTNSTNLKNMCFNDMECVNNRTDDDYADKWGSCNCSIGYRGYLCEYTENCIDDYDEECLNNGICVTADGPNYGKCNCTTFPNGTARHMGYLCQFPAKNDPEEQ